MVIFIYGQDTYRARQKLNEIIDSYKKTYKAELNLKNFDFLKYSYQDFFNDFQAVSMFGGKKLVIIENAFASDNTKNEIIKNLKKISASKGIFIFFEKGLPEKNSLFKALKEEGKSQEFKLLEGSALKSWVVEEFRRFKIEIDSLALGQLINHTGNNLWQLSEEIKKITVFKAKDEEKTVREEDIILLVRPKIDTDIFKTIDAISAKNKKNALFLVQKHIERGDNPLYVFSMINFQFRNILAVKSRCQAAPYLDTDQIKKLSKELGLHPFVIKKSFLQARNFSLDVLKKIYQNIFEKDLAIKTGKISPDAALENLIAEI